MKSSQYFRCTGDGERPDLIAWPKSIRKKVDRVRRSLIPAGEGTPTDEEVREVWRKHAARIGGRQ